LYFKTIGRGPDTVLVVHDGPARGMSSVAPDLDRLARTHVLVFFDQRGGGKTEMGELPTGGSWMRHPLYLLQHTRDIEAVRMHLGLQTVNLLGFGWGGGLAALYATDHPQRVRRLVLVDPIPPSMDPYQAQAAAARAGRLGPAGVALLDSLRESWTTSADVAATCRRFFRTRYSAEVADPGSVSRIRGDPCEAPPRVVRDHPRAEEQTLRFLQSWKWQPMLSAIRAPTLVVRGDRDPVPESAAKDWVDSIPEASLLVVPGAGSFPHVEQPDRFFPAVERFIRGRE
jgi:pimeloyl-ACP methyl ester carboxylesterase